MLELRSRCLALLEGTSTIESNCRNEWLSMVRLEVLRTRQRLRKMADRLYQVRRR